MTTMQLYAVLLCKLSIRHLSLKLCATIYSLSKSHRSSTLSNPWSQLHQWDLSSRIFTSSLRLL